MFNVNDILEIAIDQERIYKERSALFPAGTVDDLRNAARRRMDEALVVMEVMAQAGIAETPSIGNFHNGLPRQHQRVRIRAGAKVHSTHPALRGHGKVLSRAQTVTVSHVYDGYVNIHEHTVTNAQVNWAGTGGYWHWTDLANVEV